MLSTKQELAHLAISIAEGRGISPALVCAIIEVSSQWNPTTSAWEPEPWLLQTHPLDHVGHEEEFIALGTRWGLMQFLGSKAKMAGYKGKMDGSLINPKENIEAGCAILKNLLGDGKQSLKAVLMNWYGFDKRAMAEYTMAVLPKFDEFVKARPPVNETAPAG